MKKKNPVETLVNILETSEKNVVNDEWVLSDHDIRRELQLRTELDEVVMAERQRELDQMFPDRTNGALYLKRENTDTFDF